MFLILIVLITMAIIAIALAIYFAGDENLVATVFAVAGISLLFATILEWQNQKRDEEVRALEAARREREKHLSF